MQLIDYFSRKSRAVILLVGALLLMVVAVADVATGPRVALLLFYFTPVLFASWFAGRRAGVWMTIATTAVWVTVQLCDPANSDRQLLILWNGFMRGTVFLISGFFINEVQQRRKVEAQLRKTQQELEQRVLDLARSDAAVRQQASILQSILNSMGSGVIVADAHGKILLFNPAAEQLLRINLADVTSADLLQQQETYLPDKLTAYPSMEHPLQRAIRGENIDGAEMFIRHKNAPDGVWLRASGRPLIDETGKVQGGVIVFNDLTQHKLLEKQIAEISDREQRRIGQDLHDGLCQHLVSTAFAAELLRQNLEKDRAAEASEAEKISELVNDAITQARQLARGLYPVRLEVDGLASALEEFANSVQSRTNINCRFACDEPVFISDQVAGSNLFRIAQEAVNNSLKHGRVQNISIGLGAVEDEVTLTIKDDGIGFPDIFQQNGGMGLHIMNYRARMIGAALDIRRGVGGGTIVICSFHNENVVERPHGHSSKN